MITVFHLETYTTQGSVTICAMRYPNTNDVFPRARISREKFPKLWEDFVAWNKGRTLASRDMRETSKVLGKLFHENGMQLPNIKVISYHDVLREQNIISKKSESNYEYLATSLGLEKPDSQHVLEKAEFTVKVLQIFSEKEITPFIETADFSYTGPTGRKLQSVYKSKGSPFARKVPIAEMQDRPLKTRFAETYVAFTGKLKFGNKKMKRDDAIARVEELGGKGIKEFDEHVTHIVFGDQAPGQKESGSEKEREAKEKKLIIIPASLFFELIEH